MATKAPARAAVKTKLVDLLRRHAALRDVQVEQGVPLGGELAHEHVLVENITGVSQIRNIKAGRKFREDTFTITVHILAGKPGQDAKTADARAVQLYGALDDLLATDVTLGRVPGLQHATLGEVDGPNAWGAEEGWIAGITAQIVCLTHLN